MSFTEPGMISDAIMMVVFTLLTILIFAPIWYLIYILLIELLLMPALISRIHKKDYPNLEKKKGGTTVGSLKNALQGSLVYIIGFVLIVPLWFIFPVLAPPLSILLTAYLNKKVFTYDVLQDFASAEERESIMTRFNYELWGMGFATAVMSLVPILNIFAPAVTAVAYIHYCLSRLEHGRRAIAL